MGYYDYGRCPVCGSANTYKETSWVNHTVCEAETECTKCRHINYWGYGTYEYPPAPDESNKMKKVRKIIVAKVVGYVAVDSTNLEVISNLVETIQGIGEADIEEIKVTEAEIDDDYYLNVQEKFFF